MTDKAFVEVEPLELGTPGFSINAELLGKDRIVLLQDRPFTVIGRTKAIALRDWLSRALGDKP